MVSFENFVKLVSPSLSELKVTPSFCFAFKIPDDVAASTNYVYLQFQNLESEVMEALCNVQWFFFLFHQIFFALVPGLMLRYEMILGNPQSGVLYLRQISEQSWNKIKALSTSREDRTELV